MGASPQWLRELTDERDRLAAEYNRKREAMKKVLAETEEVRERIRALEAVVAMYGGKSAEPIQESKAAVTAPLEAVGLRDAIRHVLLEAGTSMKPAAVVRAMRAGGFKADDGKTDLHVRVSNEMWRMAKRRMLQRSKHGYRFQMGNPPGVSAPEGLFS